MEFFTNVSVKKRIKSEAHMYPYLPQPQYPRSHLMSW